MNMPNNLGYNELVALSYKLVALVLCVTVLTYSGCTVHADYRVAQALAQGADPIATRCAIYGGRDACMLAAMKANK
jgi:hypothetical protein